MTRYENCTYGFYICITGFLTYYGLSGEGMTILGILMFFDVVLGIGKSYVLRTHGQEWFSTERLYVGLLSKSAILITLITLAMLLGWLARSQEVTFTVVNIMLGMFICGEMISVIQNTMMIHQKKYIPEWDAVSYVLGYILERVKKIVEKLMKTGE